MPLLVVIGGKNKRSTGSRSLFPQDGMEAIFVGKEKGEEGMGP